MTQPSLMTLQEPCHQHSSANQQESRAGRRRTGLCPANRRGNRMVARTLAAGSHDHLRYHALYITLHGIFASMTLYDGICHASTSFISSYWQASAHCGWQSGCRGEAMTLVFLSTSSSFRYQISPIRG